MTGQKRRALKAGEAFLAKVFTPENQRRLIPRRLFSQPQLHPPLICRDISYRRLFQWPTFQFQGASQTLDHATSYKPLLGVPAQGKEFRPHGRPNPALQTVV